MNKIIAPIILCLISVVVVIISIEIFFRVKYPLITFNSMHKLTWLSVGNYYENYFKKAFTLDPNFGFRPILGTIFYDKHGAQVNNYPFKKRDGITRILFIGDSVTQNHNIIDGIKQYYGNDKYEYWNAGVGSYNTVQEVNYYKKYNYAIHPDVVILTFVFNDFDVTPIAFYNSPNDLVVYSPKRSVHNLSPFLYKNSYFYRMLIGYLISKSNNRGVVDAKKSLVDLNSILQKENIKFIVIVSPWLKSTNSLTFYEKNYRSTAVNMFDGLKINYFDLTNVVDQAIAEKINLRDSVDNDEIHPSRELGLFFGKYLYENNIFNK